MTPEELIPGFALRPAWRLGDPRIEADAIAFWARLNILPPGVVAADRAKELVAVVYKGEDLVGVQTAVIEQVEQVRTRLAMIRGAVDPGHRRSRIAFALTLYSRSLLELWSRDHPEERLGGLGAIVEAAELAERAREPYWPQTRFILAGFRPDGRQLRISWFEDFRVESGETWALSPAAGPVGRSPARTRSDSGCPAIERRAPSGSAPRGSPRRRTIP